MNVTPSQLLDAIPTVAQHIALGNQTVIWLDRSVEIEERLINTTLSQNELNFASTIKAPQRRSEFERSRYLLRTVTKWTGDFLAQPDNTPSWPEGLLGSITHKSGHIALGLVPTHPLLSLGIDCEDANKNIAHLEEKICTQRDREFLKDLAKKHGVEASSLIPLLFSVKEALFKCHFPLGRKMFWFHDAELESIDLAAGTVALKVLVDTSPTTPTGYVSSGYFTKKSASNGSYWLTLVSL